MDVQDLVNAARSLDGVPLTRSALPAGSLGTLVRDRAMADPDRIWMVYYDAEGTRSEITFGEFAERISATAAYLKAHGIGRGDRIATVAHNHPDTVVQYFAAWWIGATVVPINVGEDDDRIGYILSNSRTKLAFVREEYLGRVVDIRSTINGSFDLVVCGDTRDDLPCFEEVLSDTSAPRPEPLADLIDEECLIVYTSGTTGNPKGVRLAHGNVLADAAGIADWHRIDERTRMMCVLPIHHVNGTVVTLVTPMVAHSSVVLNCRFQSHSFFQRVAAEGVAVVSVVPTLLAFLIGADIDTAQLDLGAFRHVICGAGPLTCELAERFEQRYGVPIIHGYGLSETTCYSCFLPVSLDEEVRRAWLTGHGFPSIGVPIPQNQMAIHDDHGNEVGEAERGEIVIRGHNVMLGYDSNPEANAHAFAHGWFRSGDEGFSIQGEDGHRYFFITGRLKELIIRGGVNISPLEIDEVINSHPKVDAGIAVGFENTWYGEEVGAFVRPADPSLTAEELLGFCRTHLPYHKAPKVVVFGDDIPVTSTGKYQRNRVRDRFDEHRQTQFREARPSKI